MSTSITRRACPRCGAVNDSVTDLSNPDALPKPNDVALCIACGLIEVFDDALDRRPITRAEFMALDEETREAVASAYAAIRTMNLDDWIRA